MIELLNMDCMEYMKGLKDNAFDLAIVDPPYGIGEDGGKFRHGPKSKAKGFRVKSYTKKEWDRKTPNKEYFDELNRVSKNQIIWGGNYFADKLPTSSCWLIWDKKGFDKSDFADAELAWSSFKSSVRIFKYDWIGFGHLNLPEKRNRIHPTQKPIALYKWILKNYAKPGDKILDTHGGSMSSAIACHEMGFDLTLCEIDKDYYEAGLKRVAEAMKQQVLFNYEPEEVR